MATAAACSGNGGGDRRSSRGKGKIIVGPHDKPKKMNTWERAILRYLERCHKNVVGGLRTSLLSWLIEAWSISWTL